MGRSVRGDEPADKTGAAGRGESVRPTDRAGVVDKVASILDALASGPASLNDVVARTALPRATAHRLALALCRHGLVGRDDEGRFVLGLRMIGLGRAAADAMPLRALARPALEALRDQTGESVQLYVPDEGGRRCVVSLQSPHGLRWIVAEGALLPMDRGSAGKVLSGATGPGTWAESVEEREPGVVSVSGGIHGSAGVLIGAVSVSGPVERLSRAPGRRFGPQVVAAADAITAAAGSSVLSIG
jgi:DNA-binding IclR family transcriptional regulator